MIEEERHTVGWESWATLSALAANRSGWKDRECQNLVCLMV